MSKSNSIQEGIKLIKLSIKKKIKLNELCVREGKARNYVSTLVWEARSGKTREYATEQEINELLDVYEVYLEKATNFQSKTNKSFTGKPKASKNKDLISEATEAQEKFEDLTPKEQEEVLYDAWKNVNYNKKNQGEI
jgi:hypothetical protein